MPGKDQKHHFALLNRAGDLARKRTPRPNIARRDPAPEPALLERGADSFLLTFLSCAEWEMKTSRGMAAGESACFYLPSRQ